MSGISDERLREIEARAAAATPGPWEVGDGYGAAVVFPPGTGDPLAIDLRAPDAYFIAHAREDVPALVAEVRALQAERDRLAAELELLTAGFRPASEALVDEITRHAETRRERDKLAARVDELEGVEGAMSEGRYESCTCPECGASCGHATVECELRERIARGLAQIEAGRALAEALTAAREDPGLYRLGQDQATAWEHGSAGARKSAESDAEAIHARIDAALAAWDRAVGEGGAK